ncbi:hypothetical protein [Lysobacter soyae]|jgi:hypothetical protein|uniref:Uncharacterized protein n=1 Tax=Lysobacter soyae TaxID=2764185 RepID=A0ABX8WS50_9GAMM|nr:hypothetical protein [Lysobacter sp. CJ11]QYR53675.1 hypothetical protein H8L67_04080 [Lysobacter sp. CJ11]
MKVFKRMKVTEIKKPGMAAGLFREQQNASRLQSGKQVRAREVMPLAMAAEQAKEWKLTVRMRT